MRGRTILAAVIAGAFFVGSVQAAQAAPGDPIALPTITTFTLISGPLTIVPLTAAVLTNSAPIGSGSTGTAVSGSLGLVTVLDLRGSSAPWVATAASTVFSGVPSGTSSSVVYNAGAVTKVLGTITVPASADVTLTTTPAAVVSPSAINGTNSVTWLPTLTVNLPTTALAGLYTGTVTTSVA